MKRSQNGFTLIELVVVIVILGILAATALPKFVDLQGDAAQAAADGVAGALTSASSINYAKFQISSGAAGVVTVQHNVTDCNTLGSLLTGGAISDGRITITAGAVACASPAGAGGVGTCTVSHSASTPAKTATARIICTTS